MKKMTLVYDIPTRLFHWIFAALFVGAFFIAKTFDDESRVYPYHMLMGLLLVATVVLRIVWGLFGSHFARFSSFELSPSKLVVYLKGVASFKSERQLGHHPASSWAALMMMAFSLGLAFTGYMMVKEINKEVMEEMHELFAHTFAITAICHVAGVVLHSLMHRDGIAMSMIHGQKESVEGSEGISKPHNLAGLLFLVLMGIFVFMLYNNYHQQNRTLGLLGVTLQLGESEEMGHVVPGHNNKHHERDDEEYDDD